jgi:NitT/TauT family transport system substrate-binding protein
MEGVALIQNGSASGMWANARAAEVLDKIDGVHTIAKLEDYVASTVHVGIATEQFLKERQSAAAKYLQATEEIYAFIAADPQKSAELMQKSNGTPISQSLTTFSVWINYVRFDQQFYNDMNSLYHWAEQSGVIKYPYTLSDYVNVDALNAAFPGRADYK